jgi:TonB family protein
MSAFRILVVGCLITLAFGQNSEESEVVYRIGGGVSAPQVIMRSEPEYSEEARKINHQGVVLLTAIVQPNGRVRDIQVRKPLGKGLDEQAVNAVRQWTFKPGMKDSVPVSVLIAIEVQFYLWGVPTQPELIGDAPKCASPVQCVKVRLAVKKEGTVAERSIKVNGTKSKDLQQQVKRIVMQWRFKPAMQDGNAVRSEIEIDFDLEKLATGAEAK